MKKTLLLIALSLCAIVSGSAQTGPTTIADSKLWDNWYWTASVGGVNQLNDGHSARLQYGVELGRYLTPVFGLAAEYRQSVNTTNSPNAIDKTNLSGLLKFNLSNFFGSYSTEPRFYEFVFNYGWGWGRHYYPSSCLNEVGEFGSRNVVTSTMGMELNFNLGKKRAWQFNLRPSFVWDVTSGGSAYHKSFCSFQWSAGVTYKLRNHYGTHNFKRTQLRDINEINGLKSQIEDLNKLIDVLTSDK